MRRTHMNVTQACLGLIMGLALTARAYGEGEITLKVLAINPSEEQLQRVEIKAPLPKEIKAEDILDAADLRVAYDTQLGAYYVYGEYDLQPRQTLERAIVIRDVWIVPADGLEAIRAEAAQTAALLEHTEFQERARFLNEVIRSKLRKIVERQQAASSNPERHISDFRDNLTLLNSISDDLVVARSLLAQARPAASSVAATWKLFVGTVVFLGLLSLSFYFFWYRQLKTMTALTVSPEALATPEDSPHPSRRVKREEKRVDLDDIERIIRKPT